MPSAFSSASAGGNRTMPSAFGSRESGGRTMPSAFGSGDRDVKRAEAAERAAREAATARAKKIEADKEAKRLADASNFASEESYPSLGGGAKPVVKPVALNFKKTVEVMATRAAAEEASALHRRDAHEDYMRSIATTGRAKAKAVTAKYYDDYESESGEMAYAGDEEDEESDGEFNADVGSTRRRGDKGIW
jgi:hypothetical protein